MVCGSGVNARTPVRDSPAVRLGAGYRRPCVDLLLILALFGAVDDGYLGGDGADLVEGVI